MAMRVKRGLAKGGWAVWVGRSAECCALGRQGRPQFVLRAAWWWRGFREDSIAVWGACLRPQCPQRSTQTARSTWKTQPPPPLCRRLHCRPPPPHCRRRLPAVQHQYCTCKAIWAAGVAARKGPRVLPDQGGTGAGSAPAQRRCFTCGTASAWAGGCAAQRCRQRECNTVSWQRCPRGEARTAACAAVEVLFGLKP